MTDEELVLKVKSGDNDALLDLWYQKRGLVYTFARKRYSMLVDFGNTRGADMDDLMQCGFWLCCAPSTATIRRSPLPFRRASETR